MIYTNRESGSEKLISKPPWNVKESDRWESSCPPYSSPSSLPSLITFLFGVLMFTVASIKCCRETSETFSFLYCFYFFVFVPFFVVMAILIFFFLSF